MNPMLTEKQNAVLQFIRRKVSAQKLPPTIREIGSHFGFASTGTVRDYLHVLAEKGYVRLAKRKARSIELAEHALSIPILGRVAAGAPQPAQEDIEGYLSLGRGDADIFALRVKGDSMSGKGIIENDVVIVRRQPRAEDGDIVVALLHDEATVKIFRKKGAKVFLEPANKKYRPIACTESTAIAGKVISVYRSYV